MFAIYKRELKSYFHSFIGFLFIAVTLAFLGLYFSVYSLMNGYPYFSYTVSAVAFLFLITVPILTMRVLAEEKKNKTDQLILTAPVSVGGIVLGKFAALLTVFLIPVAIISTYPLIMSQFGSIPMGQQYLAILAYFLYGMATIAICLFISSVTESQVIAAVLGFAALFLGYMMQPICSLISSEGNWLTSILGCFDLYTHFGEMLSGTLNLEGVIYYVSVTALALFLAAQSIQKRRYSVSVKNLSAGAYSTGMIALSVAVVVIMNLLVAKMPASWKSVDVTSSKMYSLTDQTKEYVASMQGDVTIYVLANEDTQDLTLEQTLIRFDDLSDKISIEYVDTTLNPMFHMQYTDAEVSANSLIVVSDKRSKVVDYEQIYESTVDYTTYTSTTTGYDGEGQITSALAYVLSDDMPQVYITEGHDERAFSSSFLTGLSKGNVEYETINLMNYEEIPEDAACLIINAAGTDFSTDDKDKVIAYLEKGGKVIMTTRYMTTSETPNLDDILKYMGLAVVEGLVVDSNPDYYYRSPYYLLPEVMYTDYTKNVYNSYYVFAPFTQGIMVIDEAAEGMEYTTILSTSEDSFSKKNIGNADNYSKEEGDQDGPFEIAVEAVRTLDTGEATLVVYGCEELFTDDASAMVSGANLLMFTDTVVKFASHEVNSSVPVKSFDVSYLIVPENGVLLLAPLVTIVMPIAFLVAGFVIWFKRRKR